MAASAVAEPETEELELVSDSSPTTCCVVGGGPGGMMLAFLLARQGIKVALLEQHRDFDRDFRGDTIHPSVLEILDQIGLAEPLHQFPHAKIYGPTLRYGNTTFSPIDFRRLKIKFPYIMLLPQTTFLEFLAEEARQYANFRLVMGAQVESLIEEEGVVRGVHYREGDRTHELRALLTVGADGRFSKVRQLLGFEPIKTSPPMDILWFRLPHLPEDKGHTDRVVGGLGKGKILAVFPRHDYWQVGYVFPKGHYQQVKAAGLDGLRKSILEIEPAFAKHVETLTDWRQFSLLSVESSRCPVWYKPGVLLIGDAAHVMSPVGGVGINYAIQDAVVAVNLLSEPLRSGKLVVSHLASVQREREWPTRIIQRIQTAMQKRMIARVLGSREPFSIPLSIRLLFKTPILRDLPARLFAFGVKRVRLDV
jgi:2-polyprenyl-6-methoxyphenol hydroxylase-like FAD-dependent oxidoreductase